MNKNRDKKMKRATKADVRVLTIDQLAWMGDDDLMGLLMDLERDRENVMNIRGRDARPLEVEICYVQRELDIRNTRKRAHAAWLANMGAEGAHDAKATN